MPTALKLRYWCDPKYYKTAWQQVDYFPNIGLLITIMWRATVTHPKMPAALPNAGRPDNRPPPSNVNHLFPDQPGEAKSVWLTVLPSPYLRTREASWFITWIVGQHESIHPQTGRIMYHYIVRRIGLEQMPGVPHLTFWGPTTQSVGTLSWAQRRNVEIATLTYQGRQTLEALANTIAVQPSTPDWNGQDWVMSLLHAAELAHLFTPTQVFNAVAAARLPFRT